jgi:hypothetical protein
MFDKQKINIKRSWSVRNLVHPHPSSRPYTCADSTQDKLLEVKAVRHEEKNAIATDRHFLLSIPLSSLMHVIILMHAPPPPICCYNSQQWPSGSRNEIIHFIEWCVTWFSLRKLDLESPRWHNVSREVVEVSLSNFTNICINNQIMLRSTQVLI